VKDLGGKVAVVTGAANGIGRGLVDVFCGEGMSVVLADIDEDALGVAAKELADNGASAITCVTDVADAASVDVLAQTALDAFGAVHVVCNNAGVAGAFSRAWVATPEEWKWVLDVNLWGVVNGVRTFVPILLKQGEGHIVNTASAAMFEAFPGMGPYAASKHAVLGLSETLRRELIGVDGVSVSVLLPGTIVKTGIMALEHRWPKRLGAAPGLDDDELPKSVRLAFTAGVDAGDDPHAVARAAVEGIKQDRFLICDDTVALAQWGQHHADIAQGEAPTWPPTPPSDPA
jgi:NADP-dependent 3-hydroxy acid dehydrogenase YdfG